MQLSSLVGRAEAVATLRRLLVDARLLTLTGAAGIGKTRLAVALGEAVLADYVHGVWFVDLASLDDPALVAPSAAAVLGIRESVRQPLELLPEALRSRAMLLVLDNCEHVIASCAELADCLLRACPGLQILATSREPLAIQGEVVWRVPGLEIPEPDVRVLAASASIQAPGAVQLFVQRAKAVAADFRLTDQNAPAVASVCRQLDGIPLAIELAAARIDVLTPSDIAARVGDPLRLLVGGNRTAPRRQQTLRATLDWSYGLLSEPERRLFSRLSVFSGGCTLQSAETICANSEEATRISGETVLDLIGRLVHQSLVEALSTDHGMRYRLLQTLRNYASERLGDSDEEVRIRDRHLNWCLAATEWESLAQVQQPNWNAHVDREHDNLRAALGWALENRSDAEPALRLAGNLYRFWWRRGHAAEGRAWLARVLDLDARVGTSGSAAAKRARARALRGAGVLARTQSDYPAAESMLSASLTTAQELDDGESIADCLYWLASTALVTGDEARARALAEQSLDLCRQLGDPVRSWPRISGPLEVLASLAWRRSDYATAKALHEERLQYARGANDSQGIASILLGLGSIASQQGQHDRARGLFLASREGFSELGDRTGTAWSTSHVAVEALARGDTAEASQQFSDSLKMYVDLGALWGIAESLEGLASVAYLTGQFEPSVHLFACAAKVRDDIGFPLPPRSLANREKQLDTVRTTLGIERFEAIWHAAQNLPVSKTVSVALTSASSSSDTTPHARESAQLTARELEVAALVARGRSNRQIADALVIAVSTAERHVANILGKLNLTSRTQLATWVLEAGAGQARQ